MKKVLFDTNVILDVLLDRSAHSEGSGAAWAAVEAGAVAGFISAQAVTTVHYLVRKELGATQTRRVLSAILGVFGVATVDSDVLRDALQLPCPDFEDAVTAAAARATACDLIVTRDPKGFRGSPVRPLTPEAALALLQ